ncbi:hypothetical protein [Natrinema salaciae]|uniref:Uncharacterized protein n=1 Tax=Natrinema salaciae TaxID=1186196 RepID=A0A1H9AHF2_9EURY|nr:hypothetical protein [Natrinema salaciae]SEP75823.1 hypothetical protein SAMN04489841_0446 [Natrinema salaciae]
MIPGVTLATRFDCGDGRLERPSSDRRPPSVADGEIERVIDA